MMPSEPVRPPGLWKRAVAWLLLLGPLFFASYGLATWVTSRKPWVPSVVYPWENLIPLWPWTIVPYWSIDILYGVSLLVCATRRELDTHARRLLTAQFIAVTCFLLFPLKFSLDRPPLEGMFGLMFDVLMGFDKPFNQAPSLHITLLVVLWARFAAHAQGALRWLLHGWFFLIGLSVLTTWQHHFIDVPTGMLAGFVCLWLWPQDRPSPLRTARLATEPERWRMAALYLAGAAALTLPAWLGGAWLWLLWPAFALLMVASNYAWFGADGFQKQSNGRLSTAVRWLLAPCLIGARVNAWWWTRSRPHPDEVIDEVWLGRQPSARDLKRVRHAAVVDVAAELSMARSKLHYRSVPALDLVSPDAVACRQAVEHIEQLRPCGPVLVCCALGYSRSATMVAAWLLQTGRASDVEQALALIRRARPRLVIGPAHRRVLQTFVSPLRPTMPAASEGAVHDA